DDPLTEIDRIREAVGVLRVSVDDLLSAESLDKDQKQVLEAYRMFAHSRGWLRRSCRSPHRRSPQASARAT
ncbi:MAG: hypothetical protein Q8R97_04090, partial [Brevundimonas sp.]|nr:hypothetical protein [Brevundimonas sp.]